MAVIVADYDNHVIQIKYLDNKRLARQWRDVEQMLQPNVRFHIVGSDVLDE